jgi:hypothetical protein
MRKILLLLLVLVTLVAGCVSPTSPTEDTPFMNEFRGYANEYAATLNLGTVKVNFKIDSIEYPHCGGMPGGRLITCHGPVPFANPRGIAAHEVCHLSGIGDEWEAEVCAHNLLTGGK